MAMHPPIAVIEDDVAMLKALTRMLSAGGFDPIPYTSAEDFLSAPPRCQPACLVLDIRLGGMSGLELQRRLNVLGSSLSVVILSGVEDSESREEARRLGCVAYLSKDCDAELLLGLIRSIAAAKGRD